MNYVLKNNSTWSGKGDPRITNSRSFSTRIPHPEVLPSLCRISHSCPNFGESRFPGSSQVPHPARIREIPLQTLIPKKTVFPAIK